MTVKINVCLRCGYEWAQNNPIKDPKTCPNCQSPYWNKIRRNGVITPKKEGN